MNAGDIVGWHRECGDALGAVTAHSGSDFIKAVYQCLPTAMLIVLFKSFLIWVTVDRKKDLARR